MNYVVRPHLVWLVNKTGINMSTFEVLGFLALVVLGVVAAGASLVVFYVGLGFDDARLRRSAIIPAIVSGLLFYFAFSSVEFNVVLAR